MILDLTLLALIPSLLVFFFFFLSDKYEKEPLYKLFACFLLGTAITVPAGIIETLVQRSFHGRFSGPGWEGMFNIVLMASLVEEAVKFLAIVLFVYRSPYFNEPFDGMIYYVAVATGFAIFEDFNYILAGSSGSFVSGRVTDMHAFYSQSLKIAAMRSFPSHAFFGAISGYFISKAKFGPKNRRALRLGQALLAGMLCHGLFNSIALLSRHQVYLRLGFYLTVLLLVILRMGRKLTGLSPFRKKRSQMSPEEYSELLESREYSKGNWTMLLIFAFIFLGWLVLLMFVNVGLMQILF
ncbi:PrsW family intramembrane metalloprotease [bacterium]|nr:PrsW family intramembrane metalloprotease [bacterium]